MKVAAWQMDLVWGSAARNLARAEEGIVKAAEAGAQWVVLPEMFATGFMMNATRAAEPLVETEERLSALAARLGVGIIGGMAAAGGADDGRGVNLAQAWGPDGRHRARYEKIHPFSYAGEDRHYRGGQRLVRFEAEGVRIGLFVCYDLRFPEIFRAAAESVDLVVVIANWPTRRRHAWRTLLMARAMDCQCFVLGVNRVGEGGGLEYGGDSMLVDPLGDILAEAVGEEALVMGEVCPERVRQIRRQFPFLKDRRPAVYGRIGSSAPSQVGSGDLSSAAGEDGEGGKE